MFGCVYYVCYDTIVVILCVTSSAPERFRRSSFGGRKIHASCLKKWFPKFHRYLKVDSSLYIRKLNFSDPDKKLIFNPDTTIKDYENFSGSAHGFVFVDLNTIVSYYILESDSFDIIGHIF
uniref:Uncharacterized protein n=1 Tax=Lactuca sativa TaxID=4236 RepID=A0A9R1W7X9_LACSA|nr:hypothetical protein LSAT_V11C300134420 [Lactuca sativa]